MKRYASWLFALGVLMAGGAAVVGEDVKAPAACREVQTYGSPDCCARCGSACPCEKHCRVVCEMKEIKKTVWEVHCEDFCAPLPQLGRCGCRACGDSCSDDARCGVEGCDGSQCDPCAVENGKNYVPPKCGKVRGKKTLVKKEVVCKVPSYKCVVVYACPNCGGCDGAEAEKAPAAPEPKTAPPAPLPR